MLFLQKGVDSIYRDMDGKEYIDMMRRGEVDYRSDYQRGVEMADARLWELVEILDDRRVLEDTLVVFAPDHGEAFPEDNRRGIIHNIVCPEVCNIKTCFFREQVDVEEPLLSKDTLRVWWPDIDDEFASIQRELKRMREVGESAG